MAGEILRIGPKQAKARVDKGKAVILDVVAPVARSQMHEQIANAIRIKPEDFGSRYKELLPQDKQIIAYCT